MKKNFKFALNPPEILLNGPLATIEGLRSGISDMSQVFFPIIDDVVESPRNLDPIR